MRGLSLIYQQYGSKFNVINDNLKDKGVAVILTIISYLFQSKYQ